MAKPRLEPHPTAITWAASGAINLEIAPKPYTITRMAIVGRLTSVTTTSVTNLNDPYDRVISRLALDGGGKTLFNFTNLRIPYHMGRFLGCQAPRPSSIAGSLTAVEEQFALVLHFGVAPWRVNPITGMLEPNPYDLTGGIPPSGSGNLTLTGAFGAAAAMGTNNTINAGTFDVYLWGVQPDPGDPPAAYMPRALPSWNMITPTLAATSGAFADGSNVPAGDFLHSAILMATNGTGAPRDDSVLNSLQLYQQAENRPIITWGNSGGNPTDVKPAELLSQFQSLARVPSDDVTTLCDAIASGGTPGVITAVRPSDSGLYYFPLHLHTWGNPLGSVYGIDMRSVAEGVLRFKYGVSDATGVTLDILYRKYQLNPNHPANMPAPVKKA